MYFAEALPRCIVYARRGGSLTGVFPAKHTRRADREPTLQVEWPRNPMPVRNQEDDR